MRATPVKSGGSQSAAIYLIYLIYLIQRVFIMFYCTNIALTTIITDPTDQIVSHL